MATGQALTLVVTILVEIAVLGGLFSRQRFGRCFGFVLYLLSVLVASVLVVAAPEIFYQRRPWRNMQIVFASLRHVMALELAFHTFKAFPAARRLARSFLWMMSVLAMATPFLFGPDITNADVMAFEVVPRMNLAAIGLFTGLGVLILWFRLPLDPIHKAIIMGIVPYLAVYSVMLRALRDFGSTYVDAVDYTNQFAWMIVTAFWAWVAWQRRKPYDDAAVRSGLLS